MKTAIIIPARFGSTRLPGKPLVMIAGRSMLGRVVDIARIAAQDNTDISIHVATDDARIADHAMTLGVECLMTPIDCKTGTDRVHHAAQQLPEPADLIINLQGDAPLTPPDFITALIESFTQKPCDVITPVAQLRWEDLDQMRRDKNVTPFSGTTCVFDPQSGRAHWFSKQILPAIRQESQLRAEIPLSPVYRHIGLYGYSAAMLSAFVALPEGHFEKLEGLEQLRILENGYTVRCVPVDYQGRPTMSGIDALQDVARAEALLRGHSA